VHGALPRNTTISKISTEKEMWIWDIILAVAGTKGEDLASKRLLLDPVVDH